MIEEWLSRIGKVTLAESGNCLLPSAFKDLVLEGSQLLAKSGVKQNDRVALFMDSNFESLSRLFSIWYLGGIAVPLAPDSTRFESHHYSFEAEVDFIWNEGGPEKTRYTSDFCAKNAQLQGPGLILFTSGTHSLGVPCFHSLARLEFRLNSLGQNIPVHETENTLCILPLHFGHGLIGNCLFPLLRGQHLILNSLQRSVIPGNLANLTRKYDVNFMSATASIWRTLLKVNEGGDWGISLRRIHSASELFSVSLFRSLKDRLRAANIYNVYGLTEFGSWVGGGLQEAPDQIGYLGWGWGTDFKVDNKGQIHLRSDGAMEYYRVNKEWRAFSTSSWYPTGDLGTLDSKGCLRILGRIKNIINRAGVKISVEAMENLLLSHPLVQDACVFSLSDACVGEEVYSAIVTSLDEGQIHQWVSERIQPSRCPKRYFFYSSLPRTSRGKLDRIFISNRHQGN